jgi:hypothetical protein
MRVPANVGRLYQAIYYFSPLPHSDIITMPVATGNAAASSSRSAARQGSATGSLNDNGEAIVKPEYVPDQWTKATFVDQPIEKTNGNIDFVSIRYVSTDLCAD